MLCKRCKREIPDGSLYCSWCGKSQGATSEKPKRRSARRSPGSGNIHFLPGKRARPYAARIGQKVIGTYASKGEAVVALDQFLSQNRPLESQFATFSQVYDAWKAIHFGNISAKTSQGYVDAYERASPLYKRRMVDLRTSDYQQIIDHLISSGRSYSLCQKQNGLFQQLNTFALERDLIDKNYASFVRLPKKPEPKSRILSEAEQASIWRVALTDGPHQQTACIAVVLFSTGMRIGELLNLRSEDVHLDEGYAIGGEKTAAGKNRIIPLPSAIREIIANWLRAGTVTLLANQVGNPLDDSHVRHCFSALMKELGIEGVTPHTCRHTCATLMSAAGVSPKAIQSILGHASYSTTASIYTHPQVAELVQASEEVFGNGTQMAQSD